MIHELKTLPKYFKAVELGKKAFEVRKDDRDFQVGDTLILKKFDKGKYLVDELKTEITYILGRNEDEKIYVPEGYVILGIKVIKDEAIGMETRETLIDFIVDSVNDLEGPLSPEDNLDLVNKLNNMTRLELEKEADFYDEALGK